MKVLRRLLCVVIAMLTVFGLFGCGEKQQPEPDPEPNPGVESVQISNRDRLIDADVYRPDAARFPVVIFSHGFNGYKDDFKESAEYLMENGIGSITFTFCGSGARDKSGMPTTDMTLVTEKEDLLAVMDYVKAMPHFNGNLYLTGGSQGGMISAMAAEERANDLKGMVLLFPGFCIPDDWNTRYPNNDTIPETVDLWGVKLGCNFIVSLRNQDIYANMASVTIPVLLFHGTNDPIVPISYSERAAQTYPNAELVTYQGEGHGFSPATMQKVNEKLLQFVRENV